MQAPSAIVLMLAIRLKCLFLAFIQRQSQVDTEKTTKLDSAGATQISRQLSAWGTWGASYLTSSLGALPAISTLTPVTIGVYGSEANFRDEERMLVSHTLQANTLIPGGQHYVAQGLGGWLDHSYGTIAPTVGDISIGAFSGTGATSAMTVYGRGVDNYNSFVYGTIDTVRSLPGVDATLTYTGAALSGMAQGVVNIANGLEDSVIGLVNLAIAVPNLTAYLLYGYEEGDLRVPYVPMPDWSRDLIVHEGGEGWLDSHAWSKGIGAAGAEALSGTLWARVGSLGKLGKASSLIDDVARNTDNLIGFADEAAGTVGRAADDIVDVLKTKCFARDTLVSTESGLRPIGEINIGDQVHSFDFASGEWKLRTVTDRIDSIYEGAVVTIEAGVSKIEATIHHPFWVIAGHDLSTRSTPRDFADDEDQAQSLPGRWVNSHELLAGDTIIGQSGEHLTIERITQRIEVAFPVSNLTIGDYHNFAVGANSILVHNHSICAKGEADLKKLLDSGNISVDELARFVKTFDNGDEVLGRLAPKSVGKLSQALRNKMKRIGNQIAGGGNRGISGAVSAADAATLGERFVGPGYRVMSGNKGLISADGLRQFRFPAAKRGVNPATGQPWSNTGIQVNFQSRLEAAGAWLNNVHLDILK